MMVKRQDMFSIVVVAAICLCASSASAQDFKYLDLSQVERSMGSPGADNKALTSAPNGMFSAALPVGWLPDSDGTDPDTMVLAAPGRGMGTGMLFVRRISVPAGADARQIMAIAYEERISKLPLFHLLGKKNITVAGQMAAVVTGAYAYQGNIQYPRIVEEAVVVQGVDAFIVHFECMQMDAGALGADMTAFYKSVSFQSRTAPAAAPPPPSAAVGKGMPLPFAFW